MKYFYPTLYFTFFLILIYSNVSYCQVTWKTSLETGYYNSSGDGLSEQEDVQIKLEGQVKYNYQRKKQNASVHLRVRPEMFGLKEQLRSMRLKAFASYSYDFDNFVGGINITSQRHLFSGKNLEISYESFLLLSDASFKICNNTPANASLGYAYHSLSAEEQSLDLIFFDTKLNQIINSYLKIGYGAYGEKFLVGGLTRTNYILQKNKNSGWRLGPKVNLSYIRDFIFNFEYRFLLHGSQLTAFPSFEHWLRIVTGKIFGERWSVFLLADYYTRKFKTKDLTLTENNLLYTPMNLENRIYLKLGYEINQSTEIFFKSGYFNESLYKNNLSIKGWSWMIGVEVGG
ncbi:MAG: hypothetical protein Q8K98_08910 [Bacteroidota bacterium]|nr:hypothetical protein [Bacteroidota bacterium]